jgi:hypothetical protein
LFLADILKYMASTSISRMHPSPISVVRVILSIAARESRVVHRLDVSNAFVRASLAEVMYVRPPKILADRFGSKIMKLNKALYGLRHAPLSWHFHLEKMFDTVNIIKTPTTCLYAYKTALSWSTSTIK